MIGKTLNDFSRQSIQLTLLVDNVHQAILGTSIFIPGLNDGDKNFPSNAHDVPLSSKLLQDVISWSCQKSYEIRKNSQ